VTVRLGGHPPHRQLGTGEFDSQRQEDCGKKGTNRLPLELPCGPVEEVDMKRHAIIAATVAAMLAIATGAYAQAAPDFSKSANPELVGALAKELKSTPQQAEGAAGALFDAARQKMPASDWAKVSSAVPGMDGLLKAAPSAAVGTTGAAGAAAGMAGGLGSAAAAFSKLGLKPDMVAKAVPILTQYVSKSGGAGVGSLLAGALK
jgi:hypothetical protein